MNGKRLLLVGWDSADWSILQGLADSGQVPTFAGFLEQGTAGKIRTLYPTHAPLLWTSIATGAAADRHGILAAFECEAPGRLRPPRPRSRRVKALWNMTTERGLKTHVIGWPVTDPPEEVHGVCVTGQGAVSPHDLTDTMAGLQLPLADLPVDVLLEFVPRAGEILQRYDDRLTRVAAGLSRLCSIHNQATWVLENRAWDFAAVYYDAIAYFSRHFMPFHPPQVQGVSAGDFAIYRDVVTAAYRLSDMMLARLVELAGPDCTVVLVSGHGFESGDRRPPWTGKTRHEPESWHTRYGFVAMQGPQIIPDNLLHGGTLLDVTPTVLSLLGLPAAEDMEGRVLLDAFAETPRLDRITSWEDQPEPSLPSEDSTGARGVAEHFIAFNRLNPNPQGSVDSLEEALFNLVCVYMSTGRPVPALPLIEKLAEIAPEDPRYQRSLVQCHLSLGQIDEAGNLLGRLISGHEVFGWMHFLQGVVSMHQGDVDAAFLAFRKAEQDQAYAPAVPAFVGNVYLSKGMLPRAEEAYETALGFDSENAEAHVGLAGVRLEQQRYQEAADHALKAINLQYELPNAHYQLGIALERLGDTSRALVAYRAALKLAPYLSVAQARLDRLGTSLN